MHFRFVVVHINWPDSHCKEFESIGNRAVVGVVLNRIAKDIVVVGVVVVVDEGLGDLDESDEPVNDWSFFTQNFSQVSTIGNRTNAFK